MAAQHTTSRPNKSIEHKVAHGIQPEDKSAEPDVTTDGSHTLLLHFTHADFPHPRPWILKRVVTRETTITPVSIRANHTGSTIHITVKTSTELQQLKDYNWSTVLKYPKDEISVSTLNSPQTDGRTMIIIRRLPHWATENDIKEIMNTLQHTTTNGITNIPVDVTSVHPYMSSRPKTKGQFYGVARVTLKSPEQRQKLLKIQSATSPYTFSRIIFEDFFCSPRLNRCSKCHKIGHSASKCNGREEVCPRCLTHHHPDTECEVLPCVNCHATSHISNSPKCPNLSKTNMERKKYISEQRANVQDQKQSQAVPQVSDIRPTQPGRAPPARPTHDSYSSAVQPPVTDLSSPTALLTQLHKLRSDIHHMIDCVEHLVASGRINISPSPVSADHTDQLSFLASAQQRLQQNIQKNVQQERRRNRTEIHQRNRQQGIQPDNQRDDQQSFDSTPQQNPPCDSSPNQQSDQQNSLPTQSPKGSHRSSSPTSQINIQTSPHPKSPPQHQLLGESRDCETPLGLDSAEEASPYSSDDENMFSKEQQEEATLAKWKLVTNKRTPNRTTPKKDKHVSKRTKHQPPDKPR